MNILIENRQKKIPIERRQIRHSLDKLLRHLGMASGEVSLLFTDDQGIRDINRRYLQRDYPTNVISFAMTEGIYSQISPQVLGDIVISVETAHREGLANGLTFREYVDFLIIHGLLHLIGYDHEGVNNEEARKMEQKEDELFFLLHKTPLQR